MTDNMRWQEKKMFEAAKAGDADALLAAFNAGADVKAEDANNRTALFHAVAQADHAIIDRLLIERADPHAGDARYYTPLMHAVISADFVAFEKMLKAGGDINHQAVAGQSLTLLHSAIFADAKDGRTDRVAFLLAQGAELDKLYVYDGQMPKTPHALACHILDETAELAIMIVAEAARRQAMVRDAQNQADAARHAQERRRIETLHKHARCSTLRLKL